MKRFKARQACLAFVMLILSVFLITACGGGGGWRYRTLAAKLIQSSQCYLHPAGFDHPGRCMYYSLGTHNTHSDVVKSH
jgi:hypothetical protein